MSQDSIQITTTPPLPGLSLVQGINAANLAVASDFSGDTDPAAFAGAFMYWADTANGVLKRRNAANTAWVIISELFPTAGTNWLGKAIGEIFYLRDDIAGVTAPPNTSSSFRFVKLTASDSYNSGVLTSESVTGSAPLVVATAVISLAASPINGRTVNLINSERRVLRAGSSGTVQTDAIQNITGAVSAFYRAGTTTPVGALGATAAGNTPATQGTAGASPGDNATINFDASRIVRTDTETRPKNIGVTAYMRIQ